MSGKLVHFSNVKHIRWEQLVNTGSNSKNLTFWQYVEPKFLITCRHEPNNSVWYWNRTEPVNNILFDTILRFWIILRMKLFSFISNQNIRHFLFEAYNVFQFFFFLNLNYSVVWDDYWVSKYLNPPPQVRSNNILGTNTANCITIIVIENLRTEPGRIDCFLWLYFCDRRRRHCYYYY